MSAGDSSLHAGHAEQGAPMIAGVDVPDTRLLASRLVGHSARSTVTLAVGLLLFGLPSHAHSLTRSTTQATAPTTKVAAAASTKGSTETGDVIRPFEAHVPQAALDDLRQRIASTRWPGRETVDDRSQGVQLARLQALVRYWGTEY